MGLIELQVVMEYWPPNEYSHGREDLVVYYPLELCPWLRDFDLERDSVG